jgi:hypothetical protein
MGSGGGLLCSVMGSIINEPGVRIDGWTSAWLHINIQSNHGGCCFELHTE